MYCIRKHYEDFLKGCHDEAVRFVVETLHCNATYAEETICIVFKELIKEWPNFYDRDEKLVYEVTKE